MRVLFLASEISPLVKVGGLADVTGSLPIALNQLSCEARVMIPKYGVIDQKQLTTVKRLFSLPVSWRGQKVTVGLESAVLVATGITLYLVDAPPLFKTGAVYYEHFGPGGARYVTERYVFFSWAASQLVSRLDWPPDLVHCHDWHTAIVPVWLKLQSQPYPTLLTIHNMEGQGRWNAAELLSWMNLRGHELPWLQLRDLWGDFNCLQVGIRAADSVNTVSPTYAREITTKEFGAGLDQDLAQRPGDIVGILNGVDTTSFDPATDRLIYAPYNARTVTEGKKQNRRALAKDSKFVKSDAPLFGFVGRLTPQKGIDSLIGLVPRIADRGANLIVLGSGHPELERRLVAVASGFPNSVRVTIGFDAALAQRIYAAADFFLMPSTFEPCGLGQMIAMRYGTIPIVRDTGGLHDTVTDLRTDPVRGTGFRYTGPSLGAFGDAMLAALQIFAQPDMILTARVRAMHQDFSWSASAKAYLNLYAQTIRR